MNLLVRDANGVVVSVKSTGDGSEANPFICVHSIEDTLSVYPHITAYLENNGTSNAIGDYLSSPVIFSIQPPPNTQYLISRLIIYVKDTGAFDSGFYGNGIQLSNGITLRTKNDSQVITDYTAGMPVKINPDWRRLCDDSKMDDFGTGANVITASCTFTKYGYPILLNGNENERLEIVLYDDFSGLDEHLFLVNGYKVE